ncbi:resistance protein RGA2 [Hordeum vulgare]|uniref:Uncharacterized protein n=1 Tax=Hordeum vulgare subsp. vulgare TaxID=112509 RepID=A0A8I6YVA6_HORVV|nr:resistance protein RGA2 [Hordeum vulgare]
MGLIEDTVTSLTRAVLNRAIHYAESAMAKEAALHLGIQRDQTFIADELEMMQGFLMAAHDDRDSHNRVVKIWVKQVRDVAYDVEDCLQDFAVHVTVRRSWWRFPRKLLHRRRVAKKMKELRAKVEDVSQRNLRYHLIKASKPISTDEQLLVVASATTSDIDEVRRRHEKAKVGLVRLISKKDNDLRVIAVSGTNAIGLRETSIVKRAYEDLKIHKKFECFAWIRLVRPFNLTKFLQSIARQFYVHYLQQAKQTEKKPTYAQVLRKMGMMSEEDLANEFKTYVKEKSCLIVIDDLHTIEEWDRIKTCFPQSKKGSRIIVSAEQVEVASLCVGPENVEPEHRQLFADLHAFYEKSFQDAAELAETGSSSNTSCMYDNNSVYRKSFVVLKESESIGRDQEKSDIIEIITTGDSQHLEVVSVWGMGGLGKTTLIRDVYESQELNGMFEKSAFVTIIRPFNRGKLIESLSRQFGEKDVENMYQYLEGRKYLIVLDDLSSTTEWDAIKQHFPRTGTANRIIITTRKEDIAKHCSKRHKNIYNLQRLVYKNARDLFTQKVFGKITNLDEQYPELVEQAKLILKKCSGLPLAIVIIGGFLANQQNTALEWRKLNDHISAELELNPDLGPIMTVLNKSFDGLPYYLKSCFLYMSIFPKDREVSRRRLVRRWIAEGYSREVHGRSAEEIAEGDFMELVSRSMLLPSQQSIHGRKGIDACQVHDLIREIGIKKSTEENFVFTLDEGCNLSRRATVRHLAVSKNWKGDQSQFESIVDLSRVRSITVFGKWRPFFISDKMRLLRVLDLEGTPGLADHHLQHIGKLLHLKYLSIRGCDDIHHLPHSLGNLRQLQTLDVRDTRILKLPKAIIKLRMLTYLRLGRKSTDKKVLYEKLEEKLSNSMSNNRLCLLTSGSMVLCAACCAPRRFGYSEDMNRHDICTAACCARLPAVAMCLDRYGVLVPRGMSKLIALHTLGVVNIAQRGVIQDIKELTWLRKLAVTGINRRNGKEFCSAINNLNRLESLSIRSEGEPGLCECLHWMSSPPENLQSLKLYGNLVKLPRWVQRLQNLVKLDLRSTRLSGHDGDMEVLGKMPNLAILHLLEKSFQGEELRFQIGTFRSLIVLVFGNFGDIKLVKFDQGAMPKLEQLQVKNEWRVSAENGCFVNEVVFSGLDFLPSIKEARLKVIPDEELKEISDEVFLKASNFEEHFRTQLANNPRNPILKVGELENQD